MFSIQSLALRGALSVVVATTAVSALADDASPWIYKFEDGQGAAAGRSPVGALLSDDGKLFGTTLWSGADNGGTFYVVSPNADGTWSHTSVLEFKHDTMPGGIGLNPAGGVVKGKDGGFYGMTTDGLLGAGSVYRVKVNSKGVKTRQIHAFDPALEGRFPAGDLTVDARGNLYGVLALSAQPGSAGAVFELERQGKTFVFHILHTFGLEAGDGRTPTGRLAVDAAGNVYGTTKYGGQSNEGTIYRLSPLASGSTMTVLHNFVSGKSVYPLSGVSLDADGALVGSTGGSSADFGVHHVLTHATVFRMAPQGKKWRYDDLYRFGLISDILAAPVDPFADGRLVTSTAAGQVFQLVPSGDGAYTKQVLGDVESYDTSVAYGLAYSADGHKIFGTSPVAFEDPDFNTNGAIFSVTMP